MLLSKAFGRHKYSTLLTTIIVIPFEHTEFSIHHHECSFPLCGKSIVSELGARGLSARSCKFQLLAQGSDAQKGEITRIYIATFSSTICFGISANSESGER